MIAKKIVNSSSFFSKAVFLLFVAFIGFVTVSHLFLPENHSLHFSIYSISLLGKYLNYALLAIAVDLVWGYLGVLSLGHGAFFALGGYAMGMYLMRQIGSRGVYGNPVLPDFMVFLNWKELPWFWYGLDQFWVAILLVVLVPGLLAFVFGWFAFRSRVKGVYLSIMTQAMVYALMLAFFRNELGFGGNNGLTDFKDILGFSLQESATKIVLFLLSAGALVLGYTVSKFIINSKLGKVCVAIRDAESRTRFVGYKVENYKVFVFTLSAVLAGIAGALYVPQVGIINPSEFLPINSIEIIVWVAVGGRATLIGGVIGALSVNYLKTVFTSFFPEFWIFLLGLLFVLAPLFAKDGIIGLLQKWIKKRALFSVSDPIHVPEGNVPEGNDLPESTGQKSYELKEHYEPNK